jgi:16S rRNA (adenine(1408)-N(1))-methyltransferase
LPARYDEAGLHVSRIERLENQELAQYETTWSKRLAFGRRRDIWRIQAKRKGRILTDVF